MNPPPPQRVRTCVCFHDRYEMLLVCAAKTAASALRLPHGPAGNTSLLSHGALETTAYAYSLIQSRSNRRKGGFGTSAGVQCVCKVCPAVTYSYPAEIIPCQVIELLSLRWKIPIDGGPEDNQQYAMVELHVVRLAVAGLGTWLAQWTKTLLVNTRRVRGHFSERMACNRRRK